MEYYRGAVQFAKEAADKFDSAGKKANGTRSAMCKAAFCRVIWTQQIQKEQKRKITKV